MVYRAKITAIRTWVEEHFYNYENRVVRDEKDVYIEVDSEQTAALLEKLNYTRSQERSLQLTIIATCDDRF